MRSRLIGGIAALVLMITGATPARAVGPIVSIQISPSTVSVASGAAATFTVTGTDADGATTDLTANSTFSSTDLKGSMAVNVYHAGQAGSWTITAKYSSLTSTAAVTVTPGTVSDVVINPNSDPEHMTNGQTRTFTVETYDTLNNQVKDATIVWSVEGSIGTVTSTGANSAKFTATKNGAGRLVAKVGDQQGFVDIEVSKSIITTNTNTVVTAPLKNTNSAAPTNANITPTNVNTNTTPSESKACVAWPRMAWIWMFIGYLVLLAGSLWLVRQSKPTWWWLPPFVLTVAALWMYFQFRCYPVFPGLPYLILLAAVVGSSWFTWQRGITTPTKM